MKVFPSGGERRYLQAEEVALQYCDYQHVYPEFHVRYEKTHTVMSGINPASSAFLFALKAFSIKHSWTITSLEHFSDELQPLH